MQLSPFSFTRTALCFFPFKFSRFLLVHVESILFLLNGKRKTHIGKERIIHHLVQAKLHLSSYNPHPKVTSRLQYIASEMWTDTERNASCKVYQGGGMAHSKVSSLRLADKNHHPNIRTERCLNNKKEKKKKEKGSTLSETHCIKSPKNTQQEKHSHTCSDPCLPNGIPRYINIRTKAKAKTKTLIPKGQGTSLTPKTESDQSFRNFQDNVRNSKNIKNTKQRLKNLSAGFQHLANHHQDHSTYQASTGTMGTSSNAIDHIDTNDMLEIMIVSIASKASINNSYSTKPCSKEENKYGRGEKSLSKSDTVRKMHAEYYASQVAKSMVWHPKSISMIEFDTDSIIIRKASFLDNC